MPDEFFTTKGGTTVNISELVRAYKAEYDEPTYTNQLAMARKLLAEKGREALYSPHVMTGRLCGCRQCFCCAAVQVYNEKTK